MSNLVTSYDIIKAVENGCYHNYGYHDQSLCKECREDVVTYIKRLLYYLPPISEGEDEEVIAGDLVKTSMRNKSKSIEIIRSKAKGWKELADYRLGQGCREESTEYYLRAKMLYEAARIVEDCDC